MKENSPVLRLLVPKGRIFKKVCTLLDEAGIKMEVDERSYRPFVSQDHIEVKIMKPQNIAKILDLGYHDIGFSGLDWIRETDSQVEEILDLGYDPVRIVAAIPDMYTLDELRTRKIVVASEYQNLASAYLNAEGFNYVLLKTFGATEVFPPDNADMIVDNTSTGRTLREHQLTEVATILRSSTRFVASRQALQDPWKREQIENLKMLFDSVLNAQQRVMLEMNVPKDKLDEIIAILPCMRAPTVSQLYREQGYAVKAAVQKAVVPGLLIQLKRSGATDILEYDIRKVIL